MSGPYHYTACGLEYIYLANGYEVHETPDGRGVSIMDADGLHRAISRFIISSPQRLRGQEVRFLRAELGLSQSGLAQILGAKRLTVLRWESKPNTVIPQASDRFLRLFVALEFKDDETANQIVDLLTEIDEFEHELATFTETGEGWQRDAA